MREIISYQLSSILSSLLFHLISSMLFFSIFYIELSHPMQLENVFESWDGEEWDVVEWDVGVGDRLGCGEFLPPLFINR